MLQSRLNEIAHRLNHETPREAQKAVGSTVVHAAKTRVPRVTGLLADSIHAEDQHEGDRLLVWVKADAQAPPTRNSRGGYPYGQLVEFGSVRNSAHPFLVPALEESRANIERDINLLIKEACR